MLMAINFEITNQDFLIEIIDSEVKKYSITNSFDVFKLNQFLRSLSTSFEINFENFIQYYNLIRKISRYLNIPMRPKKIIMEVS
ncbi:MAG: hypothetical protein E6936_09245 [Clostridium perfringens]|nr:hypothetical protein [Clostridium perfringens]